MRSQTSSALSSAHYQVNLACEYKTVRYVQRMSRDGVVKHVNYTPCDQTPEYNQNVKPLREKAAKIALKLRAVDAALAEKNAELAELQKEIK